MKKLFFILTVLITGCSTTYNIDSLQISDIQRLDKGQNVYVALAQDGTYNSKRYFGSGRTASMLLATNLMPNAADVNISQTETLSTDDILSIAQQKNARYVFIPVITRWEPRAAAWSGRPTRVVVVISVYDIKKSKIVTTQKVSANGRAVTFISQTVEDILEPAMQRFLNGLFY